MPSERLAASLHNLGSILIKLRDYERANEVLHRSLDLKRQVFGTTHHASVAETAMLAGWLVLEMGDRDGAIVILRHARDTLRELAPESPVLAQLEEVLPALLPRNAPKQ